MSWTDESASNQQENELVLIGLKDVQNELNKNNKLVKNLQKEKKTYKEELFQAVKTQFQQTINTLENQKTEDLEVLASKFANQLRENSQEVPKII